MDVGIANSLDQCMKIMIESLSQKEMLRWTTRTLQVLNEDSKKVLRSYEELQSHVNDLEAKLKDAQKLYYAEKQKLNSAIKDINKLVSLLKSAKDVLRYDKTLHSGTRERLSFLNQPSESLGFEKLDPIVELNSTDCLMSELSYTQDEGYSIEDSCTGLRRNKRKKRQPPRFPSDEDLLDHSKSKRRKHRKTSHNTDDAKEQLIATTTVTVPQNGLVTATSVIHTNPSSKINYRNIENQYLPSAPPVDMDTDTDSGRGIDVKRTPKRPFACQTNMRLHNWNQKCHIRGEACSVCSKKMKFSSVAVKCCNCKAVAHNDCKQSVPLPCVPVALRTPTVKTTTKPGSIEEYVPESRPMVPALVVHCIREIEARGLSEVGLYHVSGSDKQVKTLKQQLLKAKGVVNLSDVPDIHTVCGCLKEFLRSLKEPLIPHNKWKDFASASDIIHSELKKQKILSLLQMIPQANRDTLAYLILHLQRVSASPDCKMPVANLSKMFGPSVIGYYSTDPDNMYMEIISNKVMADFLLLTTECWDDILYSENNENQAPAPIEPVKTPSQSSLLGFFSNSSSSVKSVRKFKFFDTP